MILLAMQPGIDNYSAHKFMIDNPVASAVATRLVDAGIERTTTDVAASKAQIDQLNRMRTTLRQENVRRAVRDRSHSPLPATSSSDVQLDKLDAALASETAKHDALKATLSTQIAERNNDIEQKTLSSPNVVPKLAGLSGQLEALTALTRDDPKLLFFTIVFQVISVALELSPMWISLSVFPSRYAAHLSLQHFIEVSKASEVGARQLGVWPPKGTKEGATEAGLSQTPSAPPVSTHAAGGQNPVEQVKDPGASNEAGSRHAVNDNPPGNEGIGRALASPPSVAEALGLTRRRSRPGREDKNPTTNGEDHE
jgi:hypothetical protein